MKLRSIRLENVRRFTDPVRLDGIGDGLNVLSEPNEHGKSTLFDALQALFFRAHGSKAEELRALRPHAGGAPEISVDIEIDEGRFTLSKRWFSKPFARVEQGDRLVAQADAAEDWIARLMGGEGGGPAGLLWVRQGLTGLAEGTRKEQEAALAARRDLLSSVTEEVEAMTGGRRMDAALARCADELEIYCTAGGKPKKGGPWKSAEDRVAELAAEEAELRATARALQDALEARRRKRRELAEIEDPDNAAERAARLEQAQAAHAAAERHAERVETAERKLQAARLEVRELAARLETLRAALAERAAAAEAAQAAARKQAEAREAAAGAEAELDAARKALSQAGEAFATAEAAHVAAQRRQTARDGARRRADLEARLERAEAAREALETAQAAARHGPDAAALRDLEALDSALRTARALRAQTAPQLVMAYAPGADGSVTHAGTALPDGVQVPIPDGAELSLRGLGTLTVRPGAGPRESDSVEAAEQALSEALRDAGLASMQEARAQAAARAEAERRAGEARARLETAAPEGLEPLRAALAAIPEAPAEAEAEAPDLCETEQVLATARAERATAESRRDAAEAAASEARSRRASAEAVAEAAAERAERAEAALARLEERDEAALSERFARARDALEAAEAVHAQSVREAPDLAAAEAALARARAVVDTARETVARLRPEIAALDERIAHGSGEAVEERLAETVERREAAEADLARIQREVAALQRLKQALEDAQAEARDRYFAPVAAELRPLLNLLWPEAELVWGQDTLLPTALVRAGQEEPIEILSGGTQEQVALLVRLAFARLLAKEGRHAPLILDDALVFTDDDRIERMFDALHRQAGDLQVLVLTCRQRAFRDLGGRVLRLERPDEAA
ncbi:chromosome segregation protein SMC [Rhodosalinus halophilus]|uniref:Chromosome segregation protein SMC n=1 Tax=Rhodosalinus halophilus TaxID=2259333 RepID=A0A365UD81_9RHOB|nr:ATP-binding protein [Rhodosalinus halophilus]RBI87506.1 chromosome segregation protein SMC [Rhodosalinus halophilus]